METYLNEIAREALESRKCDEAREENAELIREREILLLRLTIAREALEKIYGESYPGACQVARKALEQIGDKNE